jgi:hypothetical protein
MRTDTMRFFGLNNNTSPGGRGMVTQSLGKVN